ncbi:MAG: hypothetical protein PWQ82_1124 [Thermosediminibacterales bacterium]|nr:hypothetical protein [Thermosediminibacterales bacterium]MDK2835682.1 hypothetical protein [Thermosediminibacterales bacterium]
MTVCVKPFDRICLYKPQSELAALILQEFAGTGFKQKQPRKGTETLINIEALN